MAGEPQSRLDELLPWKWRYDRRHDQVAQLATSDPSVIAGIPNTGSRPTQPAAYTGGSPGSYESTVRGIRSWEQQHVLKVVSDHVETMVDWQPNSIVSESREHSP